MMKAGGRNVKETVNVHCADESEPEDASLSVCLELLDEIGIHNGTKYWWYLEIHEAMLTDHDCDSVVLKLTHCCWMRQKMVC